MSLGEKIRAAAKAVLAGTDRSATQDFVEIAYPVALTAARLADQSDTGAETAFADFLKLKFVDPSFLQSLANAERPDSFLRSSVRNAVRDHYRKQAGFYENLAGSHTEDGAEETSLLDREADESASPVEEQRDLILAAGLLNQLPDRDRCLLKVLYVDRTQLSASELQYLALKRGVPVQQVVREVEVRAARMGGRVTSLHKELEARAFYVRRAQVQCDRLRTEIARLDGHPVDLPTVRAERQRLLEEVRTKHALQKPDTGPLRAARLHLAQQRLLQRQALHDETASKLRDFSYKLPDWDEVARICGERLGNSVQVRTDRLRARLRLSLEED